MSIIDLDPDIKHGSPVQYQAIFDERNLCEKILNRNSNKKKKTGALRPEST